MKHLLSCSNFSPFYILIVLFQPSLFDNLLCTLLRTTREYFDLIESKTKLYKNKKISEKKLLVGKKYEPI